MANMKTWASLIQALEKMGVKEMELIHIARLDQPQGPYVERAYLFDKAAAQSGTKAGALMHKDDCTWEREPAAK
jgi:hypothetical protein